MVGYVVDGGTGECDQAPRADAAGHYLRNATVIIGHRQQTREDPSPFDVAEVELLSGDKADGVDEGVDATEPVEVALTEGQGTWLITT